MNNLKNLRTENKIIQKNIAANLKIKQNTYSQYENNKRDMPIIILRKLSKYYNVNIDFILNLTEIRTLYPKSKIVNYNYTMNRFREIREDNDIMQKDIAKILGITQMAYSPYETGKADISTKKLTILALYYNVPVDYLLYLTDERIPYKRKK